MKRRSFVAAGVGVAILAIAAMFWQRAQADDPSPRVLADSIAAGKPIDLPGGTFKPTSPAADYFALPPGPQRLAFLDKMIEMQEETQKKIASGEVRIPEGAVRAREKDGAAVAEPKEKPSTSVEQSTSPDGSQKRVTIRLNSDDLSPTLRAQMEEFGAAMRARRKERGLNPNAPMMIIRSEGRTATK